ncbi:MAG TPA: hypothetical protein VJ966_05600 [Actinomycetes bacterium]|nr:hypothetical protein [Actinomycetes bacterium]
MERLVERSEQFKERSQQVQERAEQLRNSRDQSAPPDPQRLVAARRHEVEALERSIGTHEQAAAFQQRQGRPDRAAEARARADHDRELLTEARAALAEAEAAAGQES